MPQKYEFLTQRLFKTKTGMEFDCVLTDAASFERLGIVGPCVTNWKLFNVSSSPKQYAIRDVNWFRQRTQPRTIFFVQRAQWPITKPIADCLFTAVSDRHGLFPIFNDAAEHLSCRG
jgi:hypothetical protein